MSCACGNGGCQPELHVQMAQAGFPSDLVEFVKDAPKTGWIMAVLKLDEPWKEGQLIPTGKVVVHKGPNCPVELLQPFAWEVFRNTLKLLDEAKKGV